ncbi:hypothetical protein BGZ98_001478 [Dissophora globulifera]|nr:hypothetical protein BGZ98_001478 [Dissophora globulifera]
MQPAQVITKARSHQGGGGVPSIMAPHDDILDPPFSKAILGGHPSKANLTASSHARPTTFVILVNLYICKDFLSASLYRLALPPILQFD